MLRNRRRSSSALKLRAGEWVQIRSKEGILATLDEQGRLDALPFMPEMLRYCGRRVQVFKSAHKTCDTIGFSGGRKLDRVVHLEGLRCDGEFHGGCQAGCLLFWKEDWLERAGSGGGRRTPPSTKPGPDRPVQAPCGEEGLMRATLRPAPSDAAAPEAEVYCCQATELNRASSPLPWWDFRQYVRDVTSGNVPVHRVLAAFGFWMFTKLLRIGGYRALIWTYDRVQAALGGIPFPFKAGSCKRTPTETLDLQPGELVQVKTQQEILRTVNPRNRNRGLSFDEEMVEFCGGRYRVLRRVEKIIDERTGRMTHLRGDCIILDGVTCQSRFKNMRLFCPRSIYPYWREIWLRRVGTPEAPGTSAPAAASPGNRESVR